MPLSLGSSPRRDFTSGGCLCASLRRLATGTVETDGDSLYGGAGKDDIRGAEGDDLIDVGTGEAEVFADAGNDLIIATGSSDAYLRGWTGDDTVLGGSGDDSIEGGPGDDSLNGGAGADQINGQFRQIPDAPQQVAGAPPFPDAFQNAEDVQGQVAVELLAMIASLGTASHHGFQEKR